MHRPSEKHCDVFACALWDSGLTEPSLHFAQQRVRVGETLQCTRYTHSTYSSEGGKGGRSEHRQLLGLLSHQCTSAAWRLNQLLLAAQKETGSGATRPLCISEVSNPTAASTPLPPVHGLSLALHLWTRTALHAPSNAQSWLPPPWHIKHRMLYTVKNLIYATSSLQATALSPFCTPLPAHLSNTRPLPFNPNHFVALHSNQLQMHKSVLHNPFIPDNQLQGKYTHSPDTIASTPKDSPVMTSSAPNALSRVHRSRLMLAVSAPSPSALSSLPSPPPP
mgnify:FL=1